TKPRNNRRKRRERKSTTGRRRGRRPVRYAPWRLSLSFRLEVRMDDGAVLGQRGGLHELIVPVHGERLLFLVDHGLNEIEQIARVEAGCRSRDTAGNIGVADDLDAIEVDDLAGLGTLDIAAAL